MTPVVGTRPSVGLMPTMPLRAAGTRPEPAVSVPRAMSAMPSATATADPELEPPEIYRAQYAASFATQSQSYNPTAWAQLAKDLGAAQVVLTTRHHEGFALWPSGHPNARTSGDALFPAGADFAKGHVNAVRAAGLRVGLYYSPIDWRYPGYYDVTGAKPPSPALTSDCVLPNSLYPWNYEGTDPAGFDYHEDARTMKNEVYQSVKELVTDYGAVDDFWWDGGWLAQQGTDAAGSFFWEPGQYRDPGNGWLVDAAYGEDESSTGKPLGLTGLVRRHQPNAVANSRSGWVGDYDIEEGATSRPGRSGSAAWSRRPSASPAPPGVTTETSPCPSPRPWPSSSTPSSATCA